MGISNSPSARISIKYTAHSAMTTPMCVFAPTHYHVKIQSRVCRTRSQLNVYSSLLGQPAFRALCESPVCQKAICCRRPEQTLSQLSTRAHTYYNPYIWLMQMYRLLGEDKCREISIKHHAKLAFHAFPYLIAATRLDPPPPPHFSGSMYNFICGDRFNKPARGERLFSVGRWILDTRPYVRGATNTLDLPTAKDTY
jgi:hypothetical protein